MDSKQVAFGLSIVAASVGGAALVASPETKKEYVAASENVEDVTAAEVAADVSAAPGKIVHYERGWATVNADKGPTFGWFRDGAWAPAKEQKAMDKQFGDEAVVVDLVYRDDNGKLVADAKVTRGPMPEKPVPVVAEAPKPVEAPAEEVEAVP